ncbi:MAG: hypothetical protein SFY69_13065 [Planctomycetota bacterium]|nr:hypothetical protein [Planctomycetota bacterium]
MPDHPDRQSCTPEASGALHASGTVQPSAMSFDEAARFCAGLRRSPTPLARPVVVLDGWHSPGITAWGLARRLCAMTSRRWRDFTWSTYAWAISLEMACAHAHKTLAKADLLGREIDVVGISMGGLVARALAGGVLGGGDVRIHRLFTIASPHQGARLARHIRLDRASAQMKPGSAFLASLDRALGDATFRLRSYGIGRDWLVGAENVAPPRARAIVVSPRGVFARRLSHFASIYDPRIQGDIAWRLRSPDA